MKRAQLLLASFLVSALVFAAPGSAAQSADRDHPTLLHVYEIAGELNGGGAESFYAFDVGAGELTITVDVTSTDSTAVLNYELLDRDGANVLICCAFTQADSPGKSGRTMEKVTLARGQRVILHLTPGPIGKGTFKVRLGGAAVPVG